MFSATLDKRLNKSNTTVESRVDVVELLVRLRLGREEHARRTLARWIEDNTHNGGGDK